MLAATNSVCCPFVWQKVGEKYGGKENSLTCTVENRPAPSRDYTLCKSVAPIGAFGCIETPDVSQAQRERHPMLPKRQWAYGFT